MTAPTLDAAPWFVREPHVDPEMLTVADGTPLRLPTPETRVEPEPRSRRVQPLPQRCPAPLCDAGGHLGDGEQG